MKLSAIPFPVTFRYTGSERRSRRGATCDGTVHHAGQRPRLRIMQELYDGRYLGAIREWLEINDFAAQVTVQHVYFARLRELYSAVSAQHLRFADMRELYNESRQHAIRQHDDSAAPPVHTHARETLFARTAALQAHVTRRAFRMGRSRRLQRGVEVAHLERALRGFHIAAHDALQALSASSWSASHRWPSSTSVAGSA